MNWSLNWRGDAGGLILGSDSVRALHRRATFYVLKNRQPNSSRNSCSIDENSFAEAIPVPNLKTSEANMPEMIDATSTTEPLDTDFTPETTGPQTEIGEAITSLWVAHANAKHAARSTKDELRALRAQLGERLSEMKQILVKPGRGGQWSSFLMERGIPRATADRLVSRHLRSLNPDANRLSEPVPESTEEEVRKLFAMVWPKLRRTLRSRQSLQLFVDLLRSHSEHAELTVHEIPAVMPAAATFDPPSSDGDSLVEPEFCSAPPPGPDRATICAS
jgi:hypothetical protein